LFFVYHLSAQVCNSRKYKIPNKEKLVFDLFSPVQKHHPCIRQIASLTFSIKLRSWFNVDSPKKKALTICRENCPYLILSKISIIKFGKAWPQNAWNNLANNNLWWSRTKTPFRSIAQFIIILHPSQCQHDSIKTEISQDHRTKSPL